MRICLQRVTQARVLVLPENQATTALELCGEIKHGFVALIGVTQGDTEKDVATLAEKVANLRVFPDADGKLNLSLLQTSGAVLAISQFTLYADCRKGRRPSFTDAADPAVAMPLYQNFITYLRNFGIPVATGRFGAHMQVELINDGPVTILLETENGIIV